jgi:hypothetical protein
MIRKNTVQIVMSETNQKQLSIYFLTHENCELVGGIGVDRLGNHITEAQFLCYDKNNRLLGAIPLGFTKYLEHREAKDIEIVCINGVWCWSLSPCDDIPF